MKISIKANTANTSSLQFSKCIKMNCQFQSITIKEHPVYVCEQLSEDFILGNDLITKLKLIYNPVQKSIYQDCPVIAYNQQETRLEARSCTAVKIKVRDSGGQKFPNKELVVDICAENCPTVYTFDALIRTNEQSVATIYLVNAGKEDLKIPRQLQVGKVSLIDNEQIQSLKQVKNFKGNVSSVKANSSQISKADRDWIRENISLTHLDTQTQELFYNVLEEFHHVFSRHKWDIGRTSVTHKIDLLSNEPFFQRQWPLPWSSTEVVQEYVKEWLMYDIIAPLEKDSPFNTALFVIDKKPDLQGNKGHRVVLDFRKLNEISRLPKYRLPLISECIQNIARKNPTTFCILDVSSAFYNVPIEEKSQILTTFSVPGTGRFYFKRGCFGLAGLPITWQRYIDSVFAGEAEIWPYFDDIFIAGRDPQDLANTLRKSLELLSKANLKIHPKKSSFCQNQIEYLGYQISKNGYTVSNANIKAIQKATCPTDLKGIRSFIGLTGYYRDLCPYYATIMAPITNLMRKSSGWHGGELPLTAKKAFLKMKNYICSRPSLNFPSADPDRQFHLFTDASSGQIEINNPSKEKSKECKYGALGSILFQDNNEGQMVPISYHSRGLRPGECNYSSSVLEMCAAIFGIEKNSHFLYGRSVPFILYVDNKPLEEVVRKTNVKTLNRLQAMMSEYNFIIKYIDSKRMCADFCSRYAFVDTAATPIGVSAISEHKPFVDETILLGAQQNDPICRVLFHFVKTQETPENRMLRRITLRYGPQCIITETGFLMCKVNRNGRYAFLLPAGMHSDVISASHNIDHNQVDRTLARIEEVYTFPGIRREITEFIEDCYICQKKGGPPKHPKVELKPMLPKLLPMEQVNIDLYGPLMPCREYHYILVITCASTRFTRFVALKSKQPNEVARKLFEQWISVVGIPNTITSDMGNEVHSSIIKELCEILGSNKLSTSAYHPAGNASAERRMPFITNFLKASIAEIGYLKDWVSHLAPMTLSFNTGISKMTQESPHFLLYGVKPRLGPLDPEVPLRHYYGDNYNGILADRLKAARKVAREVNLQHVEKYKAYHDSKVRSDDIRSNQMVWLYRPKSSKLELEYTGPYVVLKLVGDCNAIIQDVLTHKTKFVHLNRLKPYTSRMQLLEKSDETSEINDHDSQSARKEQREQHSSKARDVKFEMNEVQIISPDSLVDIHRPIAIKQEPHSDQDSLLEQFPEQSPSFIKEVRAPSKSATEKIIDLVPTLGEVREAAKELVSPKKSKTLQQQDSMSRLTRQGAKESGRSIPEYQLPTRKRASKK